MKKATDTLTFDLIPFRDKAETISRRGKMTLDLMRREGADQYQLNQVEKLINGEIRDLRMKALASFQETLTKIIQNNSFP